MRKLILIAVIALVASASAHGQNRATITKMFEESKPYKTHFINAGGTMTGIDADRYLKSAYYQAIEDEMQSSIVFYYLGTAAVDLRKDGVSYLVEKVYDTSTSGNDGTQITPTAQPYESGNIAPNENAGMKNPTGDSRYITIPTITVSGTYTVTMVLNDETSGKNIVSHTELTSGTISDITFDGILSAYIVRNTTLTTEQKANEAAFLQSVYPEIPSKEIGEQTWSTSNLDIVATCEGTVIANITEAANVEKHTQSNAAADPNGTEANATTGWTTVGVTLTSDATSPQTGTYSLKAVANDGSSDRMEYNFTGVVGVYYIIKFWHKTTSYNSQRAQAWEGLSPTPVLNLTETDWTEKVFIVKCTNTAAKIRLYPATGGNPGDDLFIDNVSVEEVGWSGSQDLYTGLVAQGESVYDATAASAMWCYYNNDSEVGATYGKLYNWFAASLIQQDIDLYNTANPTEHWGWHVPTQTEFTTLQTALGGSTVAGGKLKFEGTDYWNTPNTGATNSSGFSILGTGSIDASGSFTGIKNLTRLWGVSGTSASRVAISNASSESVIISISNALKPIGYSIRLIKD